MDPSALIFIALAVAWAVYLIPKALEQHEAGARSRTVEGFSHTMRVLARREAVSRRSAVLVTPGRPASEAVPAPSAPIPSAASAASPAQVRARRAAAARATRRRRNVVSVILLALVAVTLTAAFHLVPWPYVAIPGGLLVAWLVACRVMVKKERSGLAMPRATRTTAAPAAAVDEGPITEAMAAVPARATSSDKVVDPNAWEMMPVTLPTYVSKPAAAQRSVRTIDLDATGVFSSGRSQADSDLVREADEAQKAEKAGRSEGDGHRAVGG